MLAIGRGTKMARVNKLHTLYVPTLDAVWYVLMVWFPPGALLAARRQLQPIARSLPSHTGNSLLRPPHISVRPVFIIFVEFAGVARYGRLPSHPYLPVF